MDPFLLAQTAEAASGWVEVLKNIVAGGASLILAVVAALLGVALYKQLRKNSDLEREFRAQVKTDADEKAGAQKEQYQQMLQREHEVQEGQLAAIQAVETFSAEMKGIKRGQNDILQRLRNLEDEVRRFPRGSQ